MTNHTNAYVISVKTLHSLNMRIAKRETQRDLSSYSRARKDGRLRNVWKNGNLCCARCLKIIEAEDKIIFAGGHYKRIYHFLCYESLYLDSPDVEEVITT